MRPLLVKLQHLENDKDSEEQSCSERRTGLQTEGHAQEAGAVARPPCVPHPAPEGSAFLLQFLLTVAVIRPQTGALLWLQEWRIKKAEERRKEEAEA